MVFRFLALVFLIAKVLSLPTGIRKQYPEIVVDYSILTGCELNIQKKCIEVHGTIKNLVGTKNGTCNITGMINCFNVEKQTKDCVVEDSGTVAYVDAYIKDVDVTKCMDEFGFTEVRELFKSASVGNEIEYPNAHRTYASGEQDTFHDDLETGEDDEPDTAGSGNAKNSPNA